MSSFAIRLPPASETADLARGHTIPFQTPMIGAIRTPRRRYYGLISALAGIGSLAQCGDQQGAPVTGERMGVGGRSATSDALLRPPSRLAAGTLPRGQAARCRRMGEAGRPQRDRVARPVPDTRPLCRRGARRGGRGLRLRGGAEVHSHRPQGTERRGGGTGRADRPEFRGDGGVTLWTRTTPPHRDGGERGLLSRMSVTACLPRP